MLSYTLNKQTIIEHVGVFITLSARGSCGVRTEDASSINYLLGIVMEQTLNSELGYYEQLGRKSNKVTVFI